MSYDQALKHWKNHRKDRFFQQCSGPTPEGCETTHIVPSEEELSVDSMKAILASATEFPIYIAQYRLGYWYTTAMNCVGSTRIESREALEQFAEDYVFSQVSAKQVTDENSF